MERKKLAIIISSSLGGAAIIASIVSLCVVVANTPKYKLIYNNVDVTDELFLDEHTKDYKYISTVQDKEITVNNEKVSLFNFADITSKNTNYKDYMIICNIEFNVVNSTTEEYNASKYTYTSGEAIISTGDKDSTYTFLSSSKVQIKNYKLTSNSTEVSVKLNKAITYKTINGGEGEEAKNAVISIKSSNMYLFGLQK